MTELTLSWSPHGEEYLGILEASVRSGDFSGHGVAWFDCRQLKETFTAALRTDPLSLDAPQKIEGGSWGTHSRESLDQCVLRIVITPYNRRGTLLVRVELATEVRADPDADQQHAVTARFLTEREMLGKFASDLDAVLDGTRETAVLRGAILSGNFQKWYHARRSQT